MSTAFLPALGFLIGSHGRWRPLILGYLALSTAWAIRCAQMTWDLTGFDPSGWASWLLPSVAGVGTFAIGSKFLKKFEQDDVLLYLLCLLTAILFVIAKGQTRSHYPILGQSVGGVLFVVGAIFAAGHRSGLAKTPSILLLIALVLFGTSTVTAWTSEPRARWAFENGSISSWFCRALRSFEHSKNETTQATEASPYFETKFAHQVRSEARKKFAKPRGVLLITVDALRADVIGREFGGMEATPNLSTLKTNGIEFERAYSPAAISHWTFFASFSGRLPSQIIADPVGLDDIPLITDRLAAAGIKTRSSFPQRIHSARSKRLKFTRENFGFSQATLHSGDLTVDQVIRATEPVASDERWFSHIHLMTPHAPYDSAPSELLTGDGPKDRYLGEVRLADRQIQEILSVFRKRGHLKDAWIIISADHGEAFGEHGAQYHGSNLFEESIHVPLIICPPRNLKKKQSVAKTPVSLVDLAPTLDDLFELEAPGRPNYSGRSWLPLLVFGHDQKRQPFVISESPPISLRRDHNLVALIQQRHKLILDREYDIRWLFDLESDPLEQKNLADAEAYLARELQGKLMGAKTSAKTIDHYGQLISLIDQFEHDGVSRARQLMRKKENQGPQSLLAFFTWAMTTKEASSDDLDFLVRLIDNRGDKLSRNLGELIRLAQNSSPENLSNDLLKNDGEFLRSCLYALAGRKLTRWQNLLNLPENGHEKLANTILRTRYHLRLDPTSMPAQEVQQSIIRALVTKSPFLRRLAFEVIAASRDWQNGRHLIPGERASQSLSERVAMLQAASQFDREIVRDRFWELRASSEPRLRRVVYRSWLAGNQLPATGISSLPIEPQPKRSSWILTPGIGESERTVVIACSAVSSNAAATPPQIFVGQKKILPQILKGPPGKSIFYFVIGPKDQTIRIEQKAHSQQEYSLTAALAISND